jgi:hypothetical protein
MGVSYAFKQGDRVSVNHGPISGIGIIKGVSSSEMPIIGAMYIVEMVVFSSSQKIPNAEYPFDHLAVPQNTLELIRHQ